MGAATAPLLLGFASVPGLALQSTKHHVKARSPEY